MKVHNLNFSYNWNNKLDNKAFTTIRMNDRFEIGDHCNVYLNNNLRCHVRVVCKFRFKLNNLSDMLAYLDTGYDKKETTAVMMKMYKDCDPGKTLFTAYTLLKVDISDPDYRTKWMNHGKK